MTIQRRIRCAGLLAAALLAAGCGSGRSSSSPRAVLNRHLEIQRDFCEAMARAGSPEAVADAVRSFQRGMEDLLPRYRKMAAGFPDWKAGSGEFPEGLKEYEAAYGELALPMMRAMAKAYGHERDPRVRESLAALGATLESFP